MPVRSSVMCRRSLLSILSPHRSTGRKDKTLNFLLGQVMRKSKGKASPELVMQLFNQKLRGE